MQGDYSDPIWGEGGQVNPHSEPPVPPPSGGGGSSEKVSGGTTLDFLVLDLPSALRLLFGLFR